MKPFRIAAIAIATCLASPAFAHPGHGTSAPATHYFSEPVHLVPLVLLSLLMVVPLGWWTMRRQRQAEM